MVGARDAVLEVLDAPRCARELRERTGLGRKTVESALRRAQRQGLVGCATPDLRQSRLYELTPLGRAWRRERADGPIDEPDDPTRGELLPGPINLHDTNSLLTYAWVQAGTYRRLVMRNLSEPMTARQLRRRIILEHPRIGANHVRNTLRQLRERSIAQAVDGMWTLTDLGERLRAVDLRGLPERPRLPARWTALTSPPRR